MTGFIERNGLWTDDQTRQAAGVMARVERDGLHLIRLAWADPHGAARAKSVSPAALRDAFVNGYNINVATSTLDGAGGRIFKSFTKGGGMGLDEMTGSPNLTIVPDPATFRVLPWAPGIGWLLCDEYFADATPYHFSSRHLLRRACNALADKGYDLTVGLEIEWYLSRLSQDRLEPENINLPGMRGKPVESSPLEPGYAYHSETNMDLMQPMLSELALVYGALDLPLRSMEKEYGPGQVECTFTAGDAMRMADDYVLFRTATRQVCRRHDYFATFMCRPGLPGHFSSGWHLHQSLTDLNTGDNLFMPEGGEALSPVGQAYLAGLLEHTVPATLLAVPTVNGYRRFQPNSLAPDRVTWGHDHRGVLMRVLGGAGDPSTRIENRAGEPAANPYLYIASQIISGLDGISRGMELAPPEDDPYGSDHRMLPASLHEALHEFSNSALFKAELGETYFDYYRALKLAELDRFKEFCRANNHHDDRGHVTAWEQNEYYDFF